MRVFYLGRLIATLLGTATFFRGQSFPLVFRFHTVLTLPYPVEAHSMNCCSVVHSG
jgi:hypothetical protein